MRRRDWTNPWTNPFGELLCTIYWGALRFLPKTADDRTADWYDDEGQPDVVGTVEKTCRDCGEVTVQEDCWWPLEREFTRECQSCGGVWVIE